MLIKEVKARKIFNSKRKETIQVMVNSNKGKGMASVPSGTSTGTKEVVAFPKNIDYSVNFLNKFNFRNFKFSNFDDFKKLELMLSKYDKTKNWSKIGGNSVLAVEYAMLKAISDKPWHFLNKRAKQVPRPLGKVIGGGKHSDKLVDFQEFLVCSLDANSFKDAVNANLQVYNKVHEVLRLKYANFKDERDYEGGWTLDLSTEEILDLLKDVTDQVSSELGFKIRIGVDIAASSFYNGELYVYKNHSRDEHYRRLTQDGQIDYILSLIEKYDLFYIEDPLHEEDFKGFARLTSLAGKRCLIVGDDLTCTNPIYIRKAIKMKSINAVIIKPNQIGSLAKTKEVIDICNKNKIIPIISHRSQETLDSSISHLAVAFNIPLIKIGIYGKERTSKVDELFKIEEEITEKI